MFYLSELSYLLAIAVFAFNILYDACNRDFLFGVWGALAVPDLRVFGPSEGTIFSWLGAWGTEEGGDKLKSS